MRNYIIAILAFCLTSVACTDDLSTLPGQVIIDPVEGGNVVHNAAFTTFIRFEDEEGHNLMPYDGDIQLNGGYASVDFVQTPWLKVYCVRESDGALMTMSSQSPAWFGFDTEERKDGLALGLFWMDMDFRNKSVSDFVESYTIHITNERMAEAKEHTIRWNLHAKDGTYTVEECIVDGVALEQKFYSVLGTITLK